MRSVQLCLTFLVALWASSAVAAFTVGREPAPADAVVLLDEPALALAAWARASPAPLPLVHVAADPAFAPGLSADALAELAARLAAPDPAALLGFLGQPAPVHRDNANWAAARAGLVSAVTWIPPSLAAFSEDAGPFYRDFFATQARGPYPGEEVARLVFAEGEVRGTFGGLPLRVAPLGSFSAPEAPVLLHIDLTFLLAFYNTDFDTPILKVLGTFFTQLRQRGIRAQRVTLATSIHGNHVPLRFRYVATWLQALLANPALLDGEPPQDWLRQGDAEILDAALRFPEAEVLYRELLTLHGQSAALRFNLARNLFHQQRYDECFALLREAGDLDPAYNLGFVKLGVDFERNGWHSGALRFYEEALARMPGDVRPLTRLGNLHFNTGRYAESLSYYDRARALRPDNPNLLRYTAEALVEVGRDREALALFARLRRDHPRYAETFGAKLDWAEGRALEALGERAEAAARYRRALVSDDLGGPVRAHAEERLRALEGSD